MQTREFSLSCKALEPTGVFEGYASTFGNVDQGGDIVEPGAFIEGLVRAKKDGRAIPMLWQHDQREPIGVWEDIAEDTKGLYVRGQFILEDDPVARRAYGKLKAGAIGGLSIGYAIPAGGAAPDEKRPGVTRLKKVDLREISLVTMPMNIDAKVTNVKQDGAAARLADFARKLRDGEPPAPHEFEDILRDAGIPKSMAVRIASIGYAKAIRSDSEGKEAPNATDFLRALRATVA